MLNAIMSVVRKSGDIVLLATDREQSVSTKEGRANFVTRYDVAVQNFLCEELKKILPEAIFIGEEGENQSRLGSGYAFIVDPIDGTTNFIKDYKKSCISVGLAKDGEIKMGIIYNPYLNEMFYAVAGEGAYLNGKPIHVSEHSLSEGVICFGTSPYNPELCDQTFALAKKLFITGLDIRRSGSAALDLCDIAAGRAELYFECILSPWDFAAGSLIVKEAGGYISTMDAKPLSFDRKCSVVAGGKAYEDFFALDINE